MSACVDIECTVDEIADLAARLPAPPLDVDGNVRWRHWARAKGNSEPAYAAAFKRRIAIDPLFYFDGFAWTFDVLNVFSPVAVAPFILEGTQRDTELKLVSFIESKQSNGAKVYRG